MVDKEDVGADDTLVFLLTGAKKFVFFFTMGALTTVAFNLVCCSADETSEEEAGTPKKEAIVL